MRIIVTGSSGHVGGAIVKYLFRQGHEIIGISRNRSTSLPDGITQLSLDIGTKYFIKLARENIRHCDAIVHAAACMNEDADSIEVSRINCLGTHQVVTLAKELASNTFVYISGLNLLGIPLEHPITESHVVNPKTVYAASKLYGEQLSIMACSPSLRTVVFRISSPIGPGLLRQRIFRLFIEKALRNEPIILHGSGMRKQDYVDVRDIAYAVEASIMLENLPSEVFNIASGCPVSNLDLATLCVKVLGSKPKIVYSGKDDPQDSVFWDMSIEKAGKFLGYAPQYLLHTSIADLAAEIQQWG